MVSDSELIARLREILRSSDLNTTTTGMVRRKLVEDFGEDLSDRKVFIREQVDLFLQSELANCENEEECDDHTVDDKSEVTDGSDSKAEDDDDDNDDAEEEEEEGGGDEGEEEKGNGKSATKERSDKHDNEGKKRANGFTKLCSLSPQLQEFVGVPHLARTEVVKQIWAYIRDNNLQDPSDRRNIKCDNPLRTLFGVDSINMFQMNKALSKHIFPMDLEDGRGATVKCAGKKQEREEADDPERKEKRQKGGASGLLAPLQLSDALVKFLGTGENSLSRADAVKRMWQYIKENNLQDPTDRRRILCDEKLKELFDVDSFNGFTVSKLLSAHFVKT